MIIIAFELTCWPVVPCGRHVRLSCCRSPPGEKFHVPVRVFDTETGIICLNVSFHLKRLQVLQKEARFFLVLWLFLFSRAQGAAA